jgi:hypothetical protein
MHRIVVAFAVSVYHLVGSSQTAPKSVSAETRTVKGAHLQLSCSAHLPG